MYIHYIAFNLIVLSVLGFVPMGLRDSLIMLAVVFGIYSWVFIEANIEFPIPFFLVNTYILTLSCMALLLRLSHQKVLLQMLGLQYKLQDTVVSQHDKLTVSEEMLRHIIKQAPDGILLLNPDGTVIAANPQACSMFGLKENQVGTKHQICEIDSRSNIPWLTKIRDVMEQQVLTFEAANQEINMSKIQIAHDFLIVAFCRDITERKKVFNELAYAQKLESIGHISCCIAHDVKNMLSQVGLIFQIKKFKCDKNDKFFEVIENVENDIKAVSVMLSKLLLFGKRDLAVLTQVDINKVISSQLEMYKSVLGNIKVVTEFEALPLLTGSEEKLEQMFMNLILNAIDAMPSGGVLDIKTSCCCGNICISIKDTGCGISDDDLPRIFEPFYSTKQQSTDNRNGTGLGLAIAYRAVKDHAGQINVSSVPGKGTIFEIKMPVDSQCLIN